MLFYFEFYGYFLVCVYTRRPTATPHGEYFTDRTLLSILKTRRTVFTDLLKYTP